MGKTQHPCCAIFSNLLPPLAVSEKQIGPDCGLIALLPAALLSGKIWLRDPVQLSIVAKNLRKRL